MPASRAFEGQAAWLAAEESAAVSLLRGAPNREVNVKSLGAVCHQILE